jgi:hypothetical protein
MYYCYPGAFTRLLTLGYLLGKSPHWVLLRICAWTMSASLMIRVRSPAQSGDGACWGDGGGRERDKEGERGAWVWEKERAYVCARCVCALKSKSICVCRRCVCSIKKKEHMWMHEVRRCVCALLRLWWVCLSTFVWRFFVLLGCLSSGSWHQKKVKILHTHTYTYTHTHTHTLHICSEHWRPNKYIRVQITWPAEKFWKQEQGALLGLFWRLCILKET